MVEGKRLATGRAHGVKIKKIVGGSVAGWLFLPQRGQPSGDEQG